MGRKNSHKKAKKAATNPLKNSEVEGKKRGLAAQGEKGKKSACATKKRWRTRGVKKHDPGQGRGRQGKRGALESLKTDQKESTKRLMGKRKGPRLNAMGQKRDYKKKGFGSEGKKWGSPPSKGKRPRDPPP